jgi:transposase
LPSGRRVGVDYHVELEGHFYSVPYRFARSEVDVRLTPRAVEIFLKGERIAVHLRASSNHRHTTLTEHMPSSHRRYANWTIERIRREAASIGPATAALCELILERRPHPEQGFRACLGIVRLVWPFGIKRLEAAATRAINSPWRWRLRSYPIAQIAGRGGADGGRTKECPYKMLLISPEAAI